MTMVRLRRYSWFFAYVCAIVSGVMVAIIPRSGAAATYSERTLYIASARKPTAPTAADSLTQVSPDPSPV